MDKKPKPGHVYAITGKSGQPSIAAGNTWAESEVTQSHAEDYRCVFDALSVNTARIVRIKRNLESMEDELKHRDEPKEQEQC